MSRYYFKQLLKIYGSIFNIRAGSRSSDQMVRNYSSDISRSRLKFDGFIDRTSIYQLDTLSSKDPTPLSIKSLLEQGDQPSQEKSFNFIKKEIPIRLANMIMELQMMPQCLTQQRQFQDIMHQYIQSFKEMIDISELEFTEENNKILVESLRTIRTRHIDTVPSMAAAVQSMEMENGGSSMTSISIQYLLDRLYTSRISIHLLISMYQAVYKKDERLIQKTVKSDCDVMDVARNAFEDASYMCEREFQEHPELEISGRDTTRRGVDTDNICISYVPAHLHHIFFEVFKNAMKATIENTRKGDKEDELPPIQCLVSKSEGDVSIRVTDQGGGISRDEVDKIWQYTYTSSSPAIRDRNVLVPGAGGLESHAHPMHGLGYGLPLSRVYARYFQGDLRMISMHGLGSDVFCYLKTLSSDAKECLPKFNVSTIETFNKQNKNKISDWTL